PRRGAAAGEMVRTSEGGKAGTMERVLLAVLLSIVPSFPLTAQSSQVLLATTTSTRDAGLLDSLLPIFERQTGYRVKLIAVGITPPSGGWYVESGQGMAATLQLADQKRAYTISDRATYLAWRDKVQLVPQVEGDSLLYNVYHVMEVNPKNAPRVNTAGGKAFADFLVAPATQALIGDFGKSRFGQSLFVPDAGKPD